MILFQTKIRSFTNLVKATLYKIMSHFYEVCRPNKISLKVLINSRFAAMIEFTIKVNVSLELL